MAIMQARPLQFALDVNTQCVQVAHTLADSYARVVGDQAVHLL